MPRYRVTRVVKALVSIEVVAEDFAQAVMESEKIATFFQSGWKVVEEHTEPCSVARDDLWDEVTS